MYDFQPCAENKVGLPCYTCVINDDLEFFAGHFSAFPLMPAVAQLDMLQVLIQTRLYPNRYICGGEKLKFPGSVQPGDILTIRLQPLSLERLRFHMENQRGPTSMGILRLTGVPS